MYKIQLTSAYMENEEQNQKKATRLVWKNFCRR